MDIQNILIIIAAITNSLLGGFVYFRNPKNKLNQWFSLFVVSLVSWCVAMFLFRNANAQQDAIFWVRILYEVALLIPPTLMYFVFTLPEGQINVNKYVRFFMWLPTIILAVMAARNGYIVSGVKIGSGQEKEILWGAYYLVYNIYFLLYFSVLFFILFKKYWSASGINKVQIRFILWGTFIPTILANFSNLTLPSFNIFYFNWLGQVMTIPMVVFIVYAILKHHLMNVKVIATEIFGALISLILLINALFSESVNAVVLNFSLFGAVSFFSILLIRGVLKEVRTREELTALTEQLKKANEDLQRLDKAKSEFISIASHQLRTPLSIIKGFVSMLTEGTYGSLPNQAKEILEKINASNERLSHLIDDLLDISRIEGGKMQFKWESISLTELVSSVADELKTTADKKRLELKWDPQFYDKMIVRADSEKLRQVIMNLIDNAIKYTHEGYVEIKLAKSAGNKTLFSVKDTGIGMDGEELAMIFGKFVRGKKVPKLWTEGIGLGLYVAKKLIEEHKGKVWAESEGEGKGSTFFVELPIY
ncbi:MAG: hypothetical protein HY764_04065 [Candidatus Portnoybacteria bacterium]|nr:hypothetical protein [Candidatus Portnoybacteria bacterium]